MNEAAFPKDCEYPNYITYLPSIMNFVTQVGTYAAQSVGTYIPNYLGLNQIISHLQIISNPAEQFPGKITV